MDKSSARVGFMMMSLSMRQLVICDGTHLSQLYILVKYKRVSWVKIHPHIRVVKEESRCRDYFSISLK